MCAASNANAIGGGIAQGPVPNFELCCSEPQGSRLLPPLLLRDRCWAVGFVDVCAPRLAATRFTASARLLKGLPHTSKWETRNEDFAGLRSGLGLAFSRGASAANSANLHVILEMVATIHVIS
jgi:hypothetical protein